MTYANVRCGVCGVFLRSWITESGAVVAAPCLMGCKHGDEVACVTDEDLDTDEE